MSMPTIENQNGLGTSSALYASAQRNGQDILALISKDFCIDYGHFMLQSSANLWFKGQLLRMNSKGSSSSPNQDTLACEAYFHVVFTEVGHATAESSSKLFVNHLLCSCIFTATIAELLNFYAR